VLEALEIELLHFVRRGFQDHLILVMLEQSVRILSEPSIVGSPRRLYVGDAPGLGPEHAKKRLRVGSARTDLEIEWLLQQAAM
jgi:hypothetical protein